MNVFVVNLARRADRRARMEHLIPRSWSVEYTTHWPGPRDGAAIRPADLGGLGLFDWEIDSHNQWWNRPLKLGEIGCAVTHWMCWQRATAQHAERTLVLEDDVTFVPEYRRRTPSAARGVDRGRPRLGSGVPRPLGARTGSDVPVAPGIVRPAYSYCTFGYMVSASGLAKLLDVGFERAIIPVDELLPALYMPHPRADVRRRYPPRLRAYAFDPPLVTQLPKEVAGSDTEATGTTRATCVYRRPVSDRPRVLVVDDERQILRALRIVLRDAGFEVLEAASVEEALDAAALRPPQAAIVDLVLPDGDGIDITRSLRQWSEMPILLLSAVGEEDQKVRALEAGADDYVTKPFGARELVARLEATLRRAGPGQLDPVVRADGLELDLAAHTVRIDGIEAHLTPIEFNVLRVLARNRGRLMTHRALLVEVWGPEYADDVTVLRAHVANLRRKIEPSGAAPHYIRTEPGVGYRFAA